jgi:hypothetical protein
MNLVRKFAGLSALAALAASSTAAIGGVAFADDGGTNGANGHTGSATSTCHSASGPQQPDMYGSAVPSQCVAGGGVGGSGGSY